MTPPPPVLTKALLWIFPKRATPSVAKTLGRNFRRMMLSPAWFPPHQQKRLFGLSWYSKKRSLGCRWGFSCILATGGVLTWHCLPISEGSPVSYQRRHYHHPSNSASLVFPHILTTALAGDFPNRLILHACNCNLKRFPGLVLIKATTSAFTDFPILLSVQVKCFGQ